MSLDPHDTCMTNPGSPRDLCAVAIPIVKAGWEHAVEQGHAGEDWDELRTLLVSFLGGVQHHLGVKLDRVAALAAAEQDRAEAHAAGFAEAVAMLRDDSRYSNWWSAVPPKPGKPTGRYWDATARGHLADYLETVVLPLPGADRGGEARQ